MNIIKVPSVFSVKLPGNQWLNLALVRRLEVRSECPQTVVVTWANGDEQTFQADQAIAIIEAWSETKTIDKSGSENLGLVDGQLVFHGANDRLIAAVKNGVDSEIYAELSKLPLDVRDRLMEVIQRLGPIQGRDR